MMRTLRMLSVGLLLIGCDTQDEAPGADAATTTDAAVDAGADQAVEPMCQPATEGAFDGTCPLADRVGGFVVENQRQFTVVTGKVANAVLPQSVRPERAREGDCRLLERPVLFCDPACGSGQTCDGEQCIAYPEPQNLGPVRIDGLQDCVQMTAAEPGNHYFFNQLGRPGFEPGAAVSLVAGDLTLHGRGVAPLDESDEIWLLRRGEPLEITWTAGAVADARVALSLSIDQHGASPLSLHCDVADTGSATVPAALVDRLIEGGVTGAPSGQISRRTADSATIEHGCVDFVVASTRNRAVRVDGFTFCTKNDDCPEGQRCDVPREVCVDE